MSLWQVVDILGYVEITYAKKTNGKPVVYFPMTYTYLAKKCHESVCQH